MTSSRRPACCALPASVWDLSAYSSYVRIGAAFSNIGAALSSIRADINNMNKIIQYMSNIVAYTSSIVEYMSNVIKDTSNRGVTLSSIVADIVQGTSKTSIPTCSCRDTSNAAANLSAECPIVSLVENSATAGSSGFHTDGLNTYTECQYVVYIYLYNM